jgi:hypothetical protein
MENIQFLEDQIAELDKINAHFKKVIDILKEDREYLYEENYDKDLEDVEVESKRYYDLFYEWK